MSIKKCPMCRANISFDEILNAEYVIPVGMCFDDEDPESNLYYFLHDVPDCGTTFTVPATAFSHEIEEPIGDDNLAGRPQCAGHCTRISDLAVCDRECRWAPFRRFLLSLIERRKRNKSSTSRST